MTLPLASAAGISRQPSHRVGLVLCACCLLFGASGCVSNRYKMAEKKTLSPPVALNLTTAPSDPPPLFTPTVATVIVFRGPGSWKRDAYWDEYVLKISNSTPDPVVIDSAKLFAKGDAVVLPGPQPWRLEKESRDAWRYNFGLAKDVTVRVGTGVLAVTTGVAAGIAAGGGFWVASTAAVVGGMVLVAGPVIGGTIYRNVSGKHEVEAEFNRRRLVLPVTLSPGQTTEGSLFFRITPGPRELVLHGRGANEADVTIPLGPLNDLHLKAESGEAQPPPASAGPSTG